jgi:hypothetical protein
MKKHKTTNDILVNRFGGTLCVLINGRWVRSTDHLPYDEAKRKGL